MLYTAIVFSVCTGARMLNIEVGGQGGEQIYAANMNLRCELVSFNRLEFMVGHCSTGRRQPWTDGLTDGWADMRVDRRVSCCASPWCDVAVVVFVLVVGVTPATAAQCWRVI